MPLSAVRCPLSILQVLWTPGRARPSPIPNPQSPITLSNPSTEAKNQHQPSPIPRLTKNTPAALEIVSPSWSLGPLDVPTARPPTSRDMTGVLSKRQQARNEKVLQELVQTVPGNNFCADCQARNPCN